MVATSTSLLDYAADCLEQLQSDAIVVTGVDRFFQPLYGEQASPIHWLTGFDGSSATVLVTKTSIDLITDARYTAYARKKVLPGVRVLDQQDTSLESLLAQTFPQKATIIFDPWRVSVALFNKLSQALPHLEFVGASYDLFEKKAHPSLSPGNIYVLDKSDASVLRACMKIRDSLADDEALFCGDCVSLSWLVGLRQQTPSYVPATNMYGLLSKTSFFLWCDLSCVSDDVRAYVSSWASLLPLDDFEATFTSIMDMSSLVYVPEKTPYEVWRLVMQDKRPTRSIANPITPLQIIKTETELAHLKQAQQKEGVAFSRLFFDVDKAMSAQTPLTEWDIVSRLEEIRQEQRSYKGPSFPTIASTGVNGAFVHYHPKQGQSAPLIPGHILLVDAGGHYWPGGTTDTTRTVALGDIHDPYISAAYTRVLKGMIAHTCAVFPEKTRGIHLEALARQFLWQEGLDYAHATGHGVGYFLNVHEPPTLSGRDDGIALKPGMTVTCEPGYYREGAFGMRLENMMSVVPASLKGFLTFEVLTLVPFDYRLIDLRALTPAEMAWMNHYHDTVFDTISPLLGETSLQNWLQAKTSPLEILS